MESIFELGLSCLGTPQELECPKPFVIGNGALSPSPGSPSWDA